MSLEMSGLRVRFGFVAVAADAEARELENQPDDRAKNQQPGGLPTPARQSNQKANVPIANAMSMMMTAVHAAGELPWPGMVPADTILLGF